MKQYYAQHLETCILSNFPVKVESGESGELNLTANQLGKLGAKTHTYTVEGGSLQFAAKPIPPLSATEQAKLDIKSKLEAGTATDADIKEALKLLL